MPTADLGPDFVDRTAPNPVVAKRFIAKVLGSTSWWKQNDIVESTFSRRMTVVPSCTGAGKTKIAADIALAWLFTAPERTVLTTAPTARQVRDLLWKEIRLSYSAARARGWDLGGELPPRASELRISPSWLAVGFSSGDPVNFQGWHSRGGTLIIIDEAVGVPDATWDALEATCTGAYDRILALANPTQSSGRFFDLCKSQDGSVGKIHIAAADTPNIAYGRTLIPGLATTEFVEDRAKRWGKDSAIYKSRILGLFPDGDDLALAPLRYVDAAVERWLQEQTDQAYLGRLNAVVEGGLDVARLGRDQTVLSVARFFDGDPGRMVSDRIGGSRPAPLPPLTFVDALRRLPKGVTTLTTTSALEAKRDLGVSILRVDADGLGAGIYDQLVATNEEGIVEVRGGRAAVEPLRFVNARTEMAWGVREALRPDTTTLLALPPDDALAHQITSLRWGVRGDGRLAVETKEEWKRRQSEARGQSSPDELDAVAMAIARGAGSGPLLLA
jgi:phage terminase large subunit